MAPGSEVWGGNSVRGEKCVVALWAPKGEEEVVFLHSQDSDHHSGAGGKREEEGAADRGHYGEQAAPRFSSTWAARDGLLRGQRWSWAWEKVGIQGGKVLF